MAFGWTVVKLLALWEGTHMAIEYHERHHYFNLSRKYCNQVGKPLLRVGMHRGMFEPPNGDYTIDIDPVIKQVPGGVWGDERDMPFEDKQFGVCFNEHTLEHQYNVNDVELAVNECVRVADIAVFLAPSPWRITTTLFAPTHFLRLWFNPHTNTIKVVPNKFRPTWMPADYDIEHQKHYSQVLVSTSTPPKVLDQNTNPSFSRIGHGFILANPEYAEIRKI